MSAHYNANVRIGNWYYDLVLQEEKAKQFLRRTKNGELKVHRVRQLFLSLLKEVPLTFPVIGLSYGASIQLVAPDAPPKDICRLKAKQGMSLTADIDFKNVEKRNTFAPGDPVLASGLLTPCVRNVWTLVPDDKSQEGKQLRFGDSFHIKLLSCGYPLYLEVPSLTPGSATGECGHVTPKLVALPTQFTRFKVVSILPRARHSLDGSAVPPFERISLMQASTGVCLAVEPETWLSTYFGMECEVSCYTYKDLANPNVPDYRNFWSFILSSA